VKFHLTATGRHLPYGITQCYLPPDTSERAPPSPQPVSRYSIYLPRTDGKLSWPRLPGNAPAGNQTRDLSITSPTPYHYTLTEQPRCRLQHGQQWIMQCIEHPLLQCCNVMTDRPTYAEFVQWLARWKSVHSMLSTSRLLRDQTN